MGVDIDTSKKLLGMLNRTRSALPQLIDEANDSGDYSKVDQAQKTLDRLLAAGQHHMDEFQKASGGGSRVEEVSGGSPAPEPQAPPQPQESAVPPMPQQPQASPESTAHEAARGAAKGIVEAQQESAVPEMDPADKAINQAYRSDKNGYDGEIENALDQSRRISNDPEDQDTEGYLALPPLERKAEMQRRLDSTFSPEMEARSRSGKANLALDEVLGAAHPDDLHEAEESVRHSKMTKPQLHEEAVSHLKNLFPEGLPDESESESSVPTINSGPDEETLAGASIALKQQYGNNGLKLAQDFERQADLDDREREYLRRVMTELGPRPKLATIPKILAALAVGVGGALGGWISGKYNGQSLLDMGADQRQWDQERAAIGREVYQAHKLWGRTALQSQGSLERAKVQQGGQDARLGVKEAGMDRRTEMTEKGKDTRAAASIVLRDRIATSRDATALAIAKMRQGDPGVKARLQPLLEQKKSLQKRFDALADVARANMMEPVEFYKLGEVQSILRAIDQVDARMYQMAPKDPAPAEGQPPK